MASSKKRYKVVVERRAEKQLKSFPKADYIRISAAIDRLAEDPRGHQCIKLTDSDNEYRMRIGNFRILYTIEDSILHVYVFEVVNRRDAYK